MALIFVSLAAGVFSASFSILGPGYGFDATTSDIDNYNALSNSSSLKSDLDNVENQVDGISIDANVFDWFSNIWNKLTAPFRIVYGTYETATSLANDATSTFQLLPIFQDFIDAAFVILVIVGIVMIKMYLGRMK